MGSQTLKPERSRLDPEARREAILDVARDVFVEEGYAAASMSTIAAKLGGSKGTLYNYFSSKEELFSAYVVRHCAWQSDNMFSLLVDDDDIRTVLTNVGHRYLETVMSDFSLGNFRIIMAEAERSPEIGRLFYESGPLNGSRRLGGYLQKAIERGALRPVNAEHAAHLFIGMCQNRMLKARLCNFMPAPSQIQIEAETKLAVDTFLAAYGA